MSRDVKQIEFNRVSLGVTSLRDASNTASPRRWKNPPTPIPVPTNSGAFTKLSKGSGSLNPYSADRMRSTIGPKKQPRPDDGAGNQTASRLPLSKRPKVDGSGLSSRHFTNNRPRRTSEVDREIEEMAEQDSIRQSSPDELLITSKPKTTARMPLSFTPMELSRPKIAQDGPSTRNLRKKIAESEVITVEDDDDPDPPHSGDILYTPEAGPSKLTSPHPAPKAKRGASPVLRSLASSGRVDAARKRFENIPADPPQIDLRKFQGTSVKKGMKGRSNGQVLKIDRCAVDESTAPSDFINGHSPSRPLRKPRQSPAITLPLDAWACGGDLIDCEDRSPSYCLVSDGQTLSVKEDVDASDPKFIFKVKEWASSIQCTSEVLFSSNTPIIITIKTKKTFGRPVPDIEHVNFGSAGLDGTIMFRIGNQRGTPNIQADYTRLLKTLPAVNYLDEHGSKAVWDTRVNVGDFPPARTAEERTDTPADPSGTDELVFSHAHSELGSEAEDSYLKVPARTKVSKSSAQEDSARTTRASLRLAASRRSSPALDPDELVLVYPPSGTGAVNLTRSDLKRLEPGQYLNDTLIEFGLKRVLNDIKEERPEFADQVHIFSSFFYKKFNIKDKEEGYRSVRKWTSKIDLFKKKYVVIPINENVHWYLAIICNPEYVLRPPPPSPPKAPAVQTRKRKRDSEATDLDLDESRDPAQLPTSDIRSGSPTQGRSTSVAADESRVESMLDACVVSPTLAFAAIPGGEANELMYPPPEDEMTMEVDVVSNPPTADDVSMGTYTRDASPEIMEVEHTSVSDAIRSMSPEVPMIVDVASMPEATSSSAIPPTKFYGSTMRRRLLSAGPIEIKSTQDHEAPPEQAEAAEAAEAAEMAPDTSYIFTFDSLGSKHPAAVKNLQMYLQMEARDKKNLEFALTTPPVGKNAIVPAQPNFCDCGVYLLHFVKTFLKDPALATERIMKKTRPKDYTTKERDDDWDSENVSGLRDELLQSAETLSGEWKKDRAAKEEQKKKETAEAAGVTDVIEDSDDDIVVSEVVVKAKPVKGKGKGKMKALPVEGETKADRLR